MPLRKSPNWLRASFFRWCVSPSLACWLAMHSGKERLQDTGQGVSWRAWVRGIARGCLEVRGGAAWGAWGRSLECVGSAGGCSRAERGKGAPAEHRQVSLTLALTRMGGGGVGVPAEHRQVSDGDLDAAVTWLREVVAHVPW